MFFMMGIMNGRKDLPYDKTVVCPLCDKYGRYNIYMTYMVLSLFFIPVFKWNKKYYVTMTCCGATYSLDDTAGRFIERGEYIEITEDDLQLLSGQSREWKAVKRCETCGFATEEDFEYCPKCGKAF